MDLTAGGRRTADVEGLAGLTFGHLSLIQYVNRDTPYFTVSENAVLGRQLRTSPERVTVDSDLGALGHHAGIDKIIVDPLALPPSLTC